MGAQHIRYVRPSGLEIGLGGVFNSCLNLDNIRSLVYPLDGLDAVEAVKLQHAIYLLWSSRTNIMGSARGKLQPAYGR